MIKSTKIILITITSVAFLTGVYFIYISYKKKRKKSDENILQNKLTKISSPITETQTQTQTQTQIPTPTTYNTNKIPVDNSNVIVQPNLNSVIYLKLDDRLKKLYNVLGMLDVNNGKLVYVADGDFIPSQPNQSPSIPAQKSVWRGLYNNYLSILNGFNKEETNIVTKNYGNKMLDLFKTKRLDYLFPSLTSNGQITEFNPKAAWFIQVEKETQHLKTDFWKN